MIFTLTLNPALDREMTVAEIEFNTVLRAEQSQVDFGGKGFNVSRLLKHLGADSTATGFLGGKAGETLQAGLAGMGINTDFIWIPGETRTNVCIVRASGGQQIKVNEKGPVIASAAQEALIEKISGLARGGDWWVLAGSLPPGVSANYYACLITLLNQHGARAVLDTSGEALRLGCLARPYLVKPNREEAAALTGLPVETPADAYRAAGEITRMGAQNVVISLGKVGALLKTSQAAWLAHSPRIQEKNPIGAGDSLVAGMVWALSQGMDLSQALRWGIASGAATASLSGTEVGSHELIEELIASTRLSLY